MLNAVFKELTILGFISLALFCAVRGGIAQSINDSIFGQNATEMAAIKEALEEGARPTPPTVLQALFEDIHILIFVIMVMYICEAIYLCIVGQNTMKGFTKMDDISEDIDGAGAADLYRVSNRTQQEWFAMRQRFFDPPASLWIKPEHSEFPFADYMCKRYTDLLVELIELPVTSLIGVFAVVVVLYPFMLLEGLKYLCFLIALSLVICALTFSCRMCLNRAYSRMLPDRLHVLRMMETHERMPGTAIDGVPTYEYFNGKILDRVERMFPLNNIHLFTRGLQTLLFVNAAFATFIIKGMITQTRKEEELFWRYGYIGYPLTLGLVLLNIWMWSGMIRKFVCVTSLDVRVDGELLRELDEKTAHERLQRHAQFFRAAIHRANQAEVRRLQTAAKYEDEHFLAKFDILPFSTQKCLQDVFKAEATAPVPGPIVAVTDSVPTLSRDAFDNVCRLLGWTENQRREATSWFNNVDVNHLGRIGWREFLKIIMTYTNLATELKNTAEERLKRLRALFEATDEDHDEVITEKELHDILGDVFPPADSHEISIFMKSMLIDDTKPGIRFDEMSLYIEKVEHAVGPLFETPGGK